MAVIQVPVHNHYGNVLRSEWTKVRSVRSTFWSLLTASALTVGLSAIICAVVVAQYSHLTRTDIASFDAASTSLTGGILAQLAIAVLGVMVITGEYATGMIRTTMSAVPQRLHVLASKVVVFAALTFTVMFASCLAAFFIGQAILSSKHLGQSIRDPRVFRTVGGTALYLTVLGLLALGIGALLRKTAGAICAVVGILFVVPVLANFLPSSMSGVAKFLPSQAGTAIINSTSGHANGTDVLGPWTGMAVFVAYAVVALVAAGYFVQRRDA